MSENNLPRLLNDIYALVVGRMIKDRMFFYENKANIESIINLDTAITHLLYILAKKNNLPPPIHQINTSLFFLMKTCQHQGNFQRVDIRKRENEKLLNASPDEMIQRKKADIIRNLENTIPSLILKPNQKKELSYILGKFLEALKNNNDSVPKINTEAVSLNMLQKLRLSLFKRKYNLSL